ncbi:FAD-dependent oxidoreductase [Aquibium sp. LZ166]|uniref:FAD-dependent oxidoreductase n=1 Tax=Aquibium pacificus TaxID=3153579 RepID=A0ABV3SEW1_9HYPH
MMLSTIVVAGGGQSGGRMAEALRTEGYTGRILLVGEEPHLPYERPPLSKDVATGSSEEATAALGDEVFWKERRIELELGSAIEAIDTKRKSVSIAGRAAIGYDQLVLATGARPRRLPLFDDPALPITYLRTLTDARWVRERLAPGRRVIIIGAGVIGLEIASSVVKMGGHATVIEAAPGVMGRAATPTVAGWMLRLQRQNGVNFHLNARIEKVDRAADGLVVTLDDDSRIEGDFAVVGIGVVPNDQLAAEGGISVNDGVIVDAQGRTSDPAVWAVGDVARHPVAGQLVRQETWRHADNHPRVVAKAILGGGDRYEEIPGYWSDQFGQRLQVEGSLAGEEVIRNAGDGAAPMAFYLLGGKLVGMAALQNSKGVALARRMIASGSSFSPADLADPSVDLRALLKKQASA